MARSRLQGRRRRSLSAVKVWIAIIVGCIALPAVGCGGSGGDVSAVEGGHADAQSVAQEASTEAAALEPLNEVEGPEPKVEAPDGPPPKKLRIVDLRKGPGIAARPGDKLTAQFVAIYYTTGELFESSWTKGRPFTFTLDDDSTSPGWVEGLPGMRVGGRRELAIPPELTSRFGVPPGTGPEATLLYVVDLLEVRPRGVAGAPGTEERVRPVFEGATGPPPKGLVVREKLRGGGPPAQGGDKVTVDYIGFYYTTGELFSGGSWKFHEPRSFVLGEGTESPGWERGLKGMRVGGRRELIVPPSLSSAYGQPPGTGPEQTLIYMIDLLAIDAP